MVQTDCVDTYWYVDGTAYMVGWPFSVIFQCNPISGGYKAWDGSVEAKFVDTNARVISEWLR